MRMHPFDVRRPGAARRSRVASSLLSGSLAVSTAVDPHSSRSADHLGAGVSLREREIVDPFPRSLLRVCLSVRLSLCRCTRVVSLICFQRGQPPTASAETAGVGRSTSRGARGTRASATVSSEDNRDLDCCDVWSLPRAIGEQAGASHSRRESTVVCEFTRQVARDWSVQRGGSLSPCTSVSCTQSCGDCSAPII